MTIEIQKLADEEEQIGLTGHLGLIGMDAIKAHRGTRANATPEEQILHAIGVVNQNQPGALQTALRALEAALSALRNLQN